MDKSSKVPLYLQLMEELIKKIDAGEYQEHEKLPSEREFCDLYGLSRITVRQALMELEKEGYIYRLHGKGTFVAPKSYNQALLRLYSFTEEMKALGKVPSSKVLSFNEIAIDEWLANKMNLKPAEEVFKVVRLRLADNEPLIYETSYLPKRIFPGLTADDLVKRPMYDVFREDYQIKVTRAVERFSATRIRSKEAEQLKTEENSPAMLIKRFAYSQDTLIEYTVSVARGDKFEYTVELL
ncbi:MAG: GntR family transcriptional regulator [Thermoactinomyces sp.]